MSAVVAEDCSVYYCITCGPCLRFLGEDYNTTLHNDVWHPDEYVNVDYEDTLQ